MFIEIIYYIPGFVKFPLTYFVKNGTKFVNMGTKKIPEGTVSRLFLYLRELTALSNVNIKTISSGELGDRANLSDVQVRKDLSHVGQFGVSGSGYDINELKIALEKMLGKDKAWNVAVIGAGHLGSALLTYPGFEEHRLNIVAAFDSDPKKIGKSVGEVTIRAMGEAPKTIKEKKISIGIITVPAESAQEVTNKLISSGVECILNFAPTSLNVPEKIKIKDVDLSRELEALSYYLTNKR